MYCDLWVYVCAHVEVKCQLQVSPSIVLLRQGLSVNPKLTIQLDELTGKLQEFSFLQSLALRLQVPAVVLFLTGKIDSGSGPHACSKSPLPTGPSFQLLP